MIKQMIFIVIFIVISFGSIILLFDTWKKRKQKHIWLTIVMITVSLLIIALAFFSMKVSMSLI